MAKRPAKEARPRTALKGPGKGNRRPNTKGLVPFKKGERRTGRVKGQPNKFTLKLKEAILQAAEMSGRNGKGKDGAVGYLVWLSRAEPAVFGRMLEKIMPMQIDVKDKSDRQYTAAEVVERLRERGLPVPPSLVDLAKDVGTAVTRIQEEDDDAALDGEGDEEQENAA